MADNNEKVQIHVDAKVTGEDQITSFAAKMKVLQAQAKAINDSFKDIGRVQSPGGKNPVAQEAAAENVRAKSRRSKKQADGETLKTAKALDSFDKASIALFKTKLSSQTKAASEALKTERQSFANFRTRNAAQSRYESSQVKALKDRMTAERRIAAMRTGAENEVVRQLKQKLNLQSQSETARQREASKAQRDQVKSDAAGVRSVRNLINTRSRLAAQRLAEERSAAREAARGLAANARVAQAVEADRIRAIRDAGRLQIQEDRRVSRERASARRTFRSASSDAYQRGAEGYRALSRPGPVVAAVTGGAAAVATRKAVTTRSDTDAAETNLRIFGSEPASGNNPGSTMTQADVVKLREEWLDKAALDNGLTPAEAIRAYTEVLKAGVPTTQARGVAEQLMASRAGMDLELNEISKLTGKVLTNRPDLDLKKFQTSFAISAGTTAADPNEIVQGYQRGMGALAGSNMSPEDLTAFIATGVGSGIQAGKTGNFIAETVATLSTAGKERGQRRKDLDLAGRMTGFGSAQGLSNAMAKDAAGTLETLFERMSKMDALKKSHVSRLIGQRNWDDEELQMVNSVATLKKTRQAVNDPRNSDYLDKAKAEKMNSWGGMWSKSLSVFNLFWEKFGAGFDGLLRDVNAFFLEVGQKFDFNKVTDVVRSALDGIKSGLGLNTWKEGFDQIKQWMSSVDIKSTMASFTGFAKGFAQGVSDVVSSIKKVASLFGTGDTSSEDIGRWTARFMGLSIALAALGPVLGVLGGLVSLVVGLGRAATAIRALVGLGGGAATGATAGAATGAGLLFKGLGLTLSRLFALGLVAEIGSNKEVISAWLLEAGKNILQAAIDGLKSAFSKEAILAAMKAITSEFIPAPVERWLNKDGQLEEKGGLGKKTLEGLPKGVPAAPVDPNERGYIGKAWDWITSSLVGSANANEFIPPPKGENPASTPTLDPRPAMESLKEAVNDNTLIHKQNFEKQTAFGGLIHKASISSPAEAVKSSLAGSSADIRSSSAVLSGSTGSGVMTGGNGPLGNSTPGSALNGGSGLSRRGILGGGGDGGGYSPPSNSMAGRTFDAKAPGIMANLQKDFGLTKEQAAGILGNLGHESAGMTAYQEGKPLGGGRGGAGWAQWTGPRRRQFEAWSAQNGLDSRSDEANYGFLKHELSTTHKGSIASLKRQSTVDGATVDFESTFERAGVKHYGSRLGYARKAFNGPATPSQVIGGSVGTDAASNVADNAARLVNLGSGDAARALGSRMTPGQWCADFVNGSLKSANIKGVNSSIANSFLGWGKEVTDGVKKGDVLVEHRGRGIGQTGGHAGIATGNQRMHNGQLQYEQISGNYGNKVSKNWENASGVIARRALETTNRAVEASKAPAAAMKRSTDWGAIPSPVSGDLGGISAKADTLKSTGWRPVDASPKSSLGGDVPEKKSIADGVPAAAIERVTGGGNGGASGGNSSSSATTNHININGSNLNSEEIANAVQRKASEGMRRQSTGASPYSYI